MDLIKTRKPNFIRLKINVKKLSRKSGKSMVGEYILWLKSSHPWQCLLCIKWYIQVLFQNLCRKSWIRQTVAKELYNGFFILFGIGKGGSQWITKQSICNQFYSDLVTKVQHGIDVPGTTIHVFTQPRWEKNTKRDIVLISKIRISGSTICSMKNCFAVIVQSGWKK